jgi:hypothetical protein
MVPTKMRSKKNDDAVLSSKTPKRVIEQKRPDGLDQIQNIIIDTKDMVKGGGEGGREERRVERFEDHFY